MTTSSHLNALMKFASSTSLIVEYWDDPQRLLESVCNAVDVCIPSSIRYVNWAHPFNEGPSEIYKYPKYFVTPAAYEIGVWTLDPLNAELLKKPRSPFSLRQVMDEDFESSEYFRLVYQSANIVDELCFGFPLEDGTENSNHAKKHHLVFGFCRTKDKGIYTEAELEIARAIYPAIKVCAEQACAQNSTESHEDESLPDVNFNLDAFGKDVLTPREREVIRLVLSGHNTESVAHRLGIAADTVKLHRKHAYAKLEVKSQGELFTLFLDFLGESLDSQSMPSQIESKTSDTE